MIYSFEQAAFKDSQTGLYNQGYFLETLNREWHRLMREKDSLSIIFIRPHISSFSEKRDFYLQQCAELLRKSVLRASDVVARFLPDEFAVALFCLNENGTEIVLQRILASATEISSKNQALGYESIHLNMGAVNVFPATELNIEQVLQHTQKMLEAAEQLGKDQYKLAYYPTH